MRILMLVLNDMASDARVDREAATLAGAGHDVFVLALQADQLPQRERLNGYTICRVAQPTAVTWSQPLQKVREMHLRTRVLVSAAVELAPDVVHAHDTDTLAVAARVAGRLRIPFVYDAHELYPDMIAEFGAQGSPPVQWYWHRVERRHVPRAAAVITVSEGLASELHSRFGCEPSVLRNVPVLAQRVRSERLRDELGMKDDGRCLALYQGVLIPGRGLQTLVDAVAHTQDVVLAVQGFGPEESLMRQRAEVLGVAERVRFMGRKAPTELHEYACGADIGVLIYEHTTLNNYLAGPNKLYSYLMAGLPVAGSAFPGIEEVIAEGQAGLTFDPGDAVSIANALESLAVDAAARQAMGDRARMLAETRYNWDVEQHVLLDVYARLATRSKREQA